MEKRTNESGERLGLKNSKIMKIVTPDTTQQKSLDGFRSTKMPDLQFSVLMEMDKLSFVETWDRLIKNDALGNERTPYDYFPNTCVALCEINRIGNEIKLVRYETSITQVLFFILIFDCKLLFVHLHTSTIQTFIFVCS
jgi:hypothetical protein